MQRCLAANGIRPINNLVDITNYVMEEYGQPMHAYDMDTIEGQEIIVRRASKDEKFVTLDGQERVLDDSVLMICDGEKAGGNCRYHGRRELHDHRQLSTVLFEAACFDGVNIRLSSKKWDSGQMPPANSRRALIPTMRRQPLTEPASDCEFGCGEVVGGMLMCMQK